MADHLPRNSSTVEEFEVLEGINILETLRDGNLNLETASRKRRKISVKYHNEDIEECYHKVRRLSNNPTVTDLENSLDETQGTPRKKKFEELQEEVIRLEDTKKSLNQLIECEKQHGNELLHRVIQSKNEDMMRIIQLKNENMMRCIQEKDEETAKKDEIIRRLQGENNRENHRKDEIIRRLQAENNRENHRKDEIIRRLEEENNRKKEEENRYKEIIRKLIEENNRKEEELIQLR